MTSKRFFFKVMREDLRHKIWMMALSALGSFLMLMLVWLVWRSNQARLAEQAVWGAPLFGTDGRQYAIEGTISYFQGSMSLAGGLLAVAGAMITGLFGFRYVFHKNMVDAYHSLPVKRDTLFAACFMDGFLIWLVPFIAFYLPTVALAGGFIGKLGGTGQDVGRLVRTALLTMAVLITVFLLVYGLVLTAVMLSGNILNTLVSMVILGLGFISLFGIVYAFFGVYMERFYDVRDWSAMAHASPLIAAPLLLYRRSELDGGLGAFCGKVAVDFILAAALGGCAWLLYRKRASELAEQGVRNRAAAAVMRTVAAIVAGMCGWILFMLLTDNRTLAWGIFGLLFGGILCFGVLNIIFSMDFRAFLTHKRHLGAVLAVTMLICLAFRYDWFGYEDYLPGKEEIAEIAVYTGDFNNRYISETAEDSPLEKMHYQDVDAIYSYLERVTGEDPAWRDYMAVPTKVTLKNGRSYYRWYRVDGEDKKLLWPLLSSRDYLECAFCISGEMIRDCEEFDLQREGRREKFLTKDCTPETFAGIIEAYNQDVLENPEGAFLGTGKRLVNMSFDIKDSKGKSAIARISVYDTMERTVAAMQDAGFGEWVSETDPDAIAGMKLSFYGSYGNEMTKEEKIAAARECYGVYEDGGAGEDNEGISAESAETITDMLVEWVPTVEITDRAEIEELCALMDYAEASRSDQMFQEGYTEFYYMDREGEAWSCYLPRGVLPEKYILRFGDC